jgi:hypothetical protein
MGPSLSKPTRAINAPAGSKEEEPAGNRPRALKERSSDAVIFVRGYRRVEA